MGTVSRSERRFVDREAEKAIRSIKTNLEFLNAAGNPKYKLVKQSAFMYRTKQFFRKVFR